MTKQLRLITGLLYGIFKRHTLQNLHFQYCCFCCYCFHDSKTLFYIVHRPIHDLVLNLLIFVKFLRLFKVSFRCSFVNKMAHETRNPDQFNRETYGRPTQLT